MEIEIALIIAGVNGVVLMINLIMIGKWRLKLERQQLAYRNIELLNKDLRAQRHDFLNHMQIAYGLMELEEYKEASHYLNKIYGDINKLSNNIRTEKIAVNALLQAKSNEAEHKGIHFFVNISASLSLIGMEEWELCGCLGNLIDNAFEAALQYEEEKCVWIRIYEDLSHCFFEIDNTGRILNKQEMALIFDEGVTTKGEEGHGQGLYLVKKMLKGYGDISVHEAEHGMIFTIRVMKTTNQT